MHMNRPRPNSSFPGRPQRRRRAGFTLAEFTLSMSITSILLVAIGSSIVLASHAIPDGDDEPTVIVDSSKRIDRMVEEIRYATSILENTATVLEFTVEDRTGDLTADTIRYVWSGTTGDPLTRTFNTGPAVPVVKRVTTLNLDYETITYDRQLPDVVSSEVVLSEYTVVNSEGQFSIASSDSGGQYFVPALPADATSWAVNRVQFEAAGRGAISGETAVQLRFEDGRGLPLSTIIEESIVLESELLNSFIWREESFSSVSNLSPDEGLTLVFQRRSDAYSMNLRFDTAGGANRLVSTDAGATWLRDDASSLVYRVYGTYNTPGAVVEAYALKRVNITLATSDAPNAIMYATSDLLNQPEVSAP